MLRATSPTLDTLPPRYGCLDTGAITRMSPFPACRGYPITLALAAQHRLGIDNEKRPRCWTPLLIVDEVALSPSTRPPPILMFSLVSSRYERASLIVTSDRFAR